MIMSIYCHGSHYRILTVLQSTNEHLWFHNEMANISSLEVVGKWATQVTLFHTLRNVK